MNVRWLLRSGVNIPTQEHCLATALDKLIWDISKMQLLSSWLRNDFGTGTQVHPAPCGSHRAAAASCRMQRYHRSAAGLRVGRSRVQFEFFSTIPR
jgi:hypothetical protein